MTYCLQDFLQKLIIRSSLLYILAGILTAFIFILDINMELGVAGGIPYVIVILFGLLQADARYFLWGGITAVVLTIAGYYLSPAGGDEWKVLLNRFYSIFSILSISVLCFIYRKMDANIKKANKELSHKFQHIFEEFGYTKSNSLTDDSYFETLSKSMVDGLVVIDEAGIVKSINPAVKDIFQYETHEVIGKNVNLLMPEPYKTEHDRYLKNYLTSGKAKIIGIGREVLGLKKDGSTFPVAIAVSEVFVDDKRNFIGVVRDVSERERLQNSLRLETLYLKHLYLMASIANETQDFDEAIRFCLHQICILSGWCIGHFFIFSKEKQEFFSSNIYYCHDVDSYIDFIAETKNKKFAIGEGLPGRVFLSKKHELIEDVSKDINFPRAKNATKSNIKGGFGLPLFVNNEVYGVIEFFSKESIKPNQRLIEFVDNMGMQMSRLLERREFEYQLRFSKDYAEKANQAKSEFLSKMSHELRTPLNSILGFSQLMQMDSKNPLSDVQKANNEKIFSSGKHLLQLINEVLDLAKIESGKLDVKTESVNLSELIEECLAMVSPLASKNMITVVNELLNDTPIYLMADKMKLKQVILNLFSNGIKYNKKNGVLKIHGAQIKGNIARIRISDTGKGLSEEAQLEAFAPFSRLGADKTDVEGTGIGLPIARNLIEAMGGILGVESILGEGSTFYFDLQLANPYIPDLNVADSSDDLENSNNTETKSIFNVLYIEDNLSNLKLVEQVLLRIENLRFFSATEALSGIDLARHQTLDLVLMDINLPDIDGYEAFKLLTNYPGMRDIPVWAVSANAMPEEIEKALDMGFSDYITKPIDQIKFLAKVEKYVNSSRSSDTLDV